MRNQLLLACASILALAAAGPPPKKVAIVLFDGVEIIDYTGPYEVFGADGFDVYTVAASKKPIITSMGMEVVPKFSFADAPQAEIVVVPGGNVKTVSQDKTTLDWITARSKTASHVMSVCNGAFTLANAGLLKGLKSTTTSPNIDLLREKHPEITVVRDQRVVDNGKIITTGGLSAGIDGALHVVSVLEGEGQAHFVAQILEYNWRPDGAYLPATEAFHVLYRNLKLQDGMWDVVVKSAGDADRWDLVVHGKSDKSAVDVMSGIATAQEATPHWTKLASAEHSSAWRIVDGDGKTWAANLDLESRAGGEYLLKVALARATADQAAVK